MNDGLTLSIFLGTISLLYSFALVFRFLKTKDIVVPIFGTLWATIGASLLMFSLFNR